MNVKFIKHLGILYVEDDIKTAELVRKTLEVLFHKVFYARSGHEALEILKQNNPHIVITDYVMPLMDGNELAGKIRDISPDIPIIFMSNYADKEKLKNAIKLQVVDYLEKPVSYPVLMELLHKVSIKLLENEKVKLNIRINDKVSYDIRQNVLVDNDSNEIKLAKSEADLLELLLENKGNIISKAAICDVIYGGEMSKHQLKNLLNRLKNKLGNDETILNVRDLGYMIR